MSQPHQTSMESHLPGAATNQQQDTQARLQLDFAKQLLDELNSPATSSAATQVLQWLSFLTQHVVNTTGGTDAFMELLAQPVIQRLLPPEGTAQELMPHVAQAVFQKLFPSNSKRAFMDAFLTHMGGKRKLLDQLIFIFGGKKALLKQIADIVEPRPGRVTFKPLEIQFKLGKTDAENLRRLHRTDCWALLNKLKRGGHQWKMVQRVKIAAKAPILTLTVPIPEAEEQIKRRSDLIPLLKDVFSLSEPCCLTGGYLLAAKGFDIDYEMFKEPEKHIEDWNVENGGVTMEAGYWSNNKLLFRVSLFRYAVELCSKTISLSNNSGDLVPHTNFGNLRTCHKCQSWEHLRSSCKSPVFKCRHCGKEHASWNCRMNNAHIACVKRSKKDPQAPKSNPRWSCVHCGEGHKASSPRCTKTEPARNECARAAEAGPDWKPRLDHELAQMARESQANSDTSHQAGVNGHNQPCPSETPTDPKEKEVLVQAPLELEAEAPFQVDPQDAMTDDSVQTEPAGIAADNAVQEDPADIMTDDPEIEDIMSSLDPTLLGNTMDGMPSESVLEEPVVAGPVAEPVAAQSVAGPLVGPIARQSVAGPLVGPIIRPSPEPAAAPVIQPVMRPFHEPVPGPVPGHVSGPVIGPIQKPIARPVGNEPLGSLGAITGPLAEPIVGPLIGPITGPFPESAAEPVTGPVVGPIQEPIAGPVLGSVVGPIVKEPSQYVLGDSIESRVEGTAHHNVPSFNNENAPSQQPLANCQSTPAISQINLNGNSDVAVLLDVLGQQKSASINSALANLDPTLLVSLQSIVNQPALAQSAVSKPRPDQPALGQHALVQPAQASIESTETIFSSSKPTEPRNVVSDSANLTFVDQAQTIESSPAGLALQEPISASNASAQQIQIEPFAYVHAEECSCPQEEPKIHTVDSHEGELVSLPKHSNVTALEASPSETISKGTLDQFIQRTSQNLRKRKASESFEEPADLLTRFGTKIRKMVHRFTWKEDSWSKDPALATTSNHPIHVEAPDQVDTPSQQSQESQTFTQQALQLGKMLVPLKRTRDEAGLSSHNADDQFAPPKKIVQLKQARNETGLSSHNAGGQIAAPKNTVPLKRTSEEAGLSDHNTGSQIVPKKKRGRPPKATSKSRAKPSSEPVALDSRNSSNPSPSQTIIIDSSPPPTFIQAVVQQHSAANASRGESVGVRRVRAHQSGHLSQSPSQGQPTAAGALAPPAITNSTSNLGVSATRKNIIPQPVRAILSSPVQPSVGGLQLGAGRLQPGIGGGLASSVYANAASDGGIGGTRGGILQQPAHVNRASASVRPTASVAPAPPATMNADLSRKVAEMRRSAKAKQAGHMSGVSASAQPTASGALDPSKAFDPTANRKPGLEKSMHRRQTSMAPPPPPIEKLRSGIGRPT